MRHTVPLPETWAETTLRDIAWNVRSRSSPSDHPELQFIGMENVEAETTRLLGTVPASTMKSTATHFQPGDVLYGRLRPYLNKVFAARFEGLASAEFIPLTPPAGVHPDFVKYRLNSAEFVAFTSRLDTGDRPRVDYEQIGDFRVALPPSGEQDRIVEAIESYLTRLDNALALLERVEENLKRYRASVLKAAVEGRLVPTEAELARREGRSYEPASELLKRILAERKARWIQDAAEKARAKAEEKARTAGQPWTPEDDAATLERERAKAAKQYKEPAALDTTDLPELAEGWCWASIGVCFPVEIGATPRRDVPEYWSGGVPWVSSGEVAFCRIRTTRESISPEGLANTSTQLNPVGTVLIGMIGEGRTRGQVAILDTPACNNQNAAAIWVGATDCVPQYVYYYLMSQYEQTRRRGSGANQPALNKARVQAIPLPLPPADEQRRIAERIEALFEVAESGDAEVRHASGRGTRLRQSILKWAFEGKLVEQNPNDEPATVLLERIRTMRPTPCPRRHAS